MVLRIEYSPRDGKWLWVWLIDDKVTGFQGFEVSLHKAFEMAFKHEPQVLAMKLGQLERVAKAVE